MIAGRVEGGFPRVELDLPDRAGDTFPVEFLIDTGFEGDLSLPAALLHRIDAEPLFLSLRGMADGTVRECPVFQLQLEWLGEERSVQVIQLKGNALLGTTLLEGCLLHIHFTPGGEVLVELAE